MKTAKCPHCANKKPPALEPAFEGPDAPFVMSCSHCHRVLGAVPHLKAVLDELRALREEVTELRREASRQRDSG
jgi:hypothetical protein